MKIRELAKFAGLCSLLLLGFTETNTFAATIGYQTSLIGFTGSGQSEYRDTYTISGIQVLANQEIDIKFDPALYASLSNGKTGPGFDLMLFQPNNPPMAAGDYSDLALMDNPPLTGVFSVDFVYQIPGTPGSQLFFVNQYASDGSFQGVITSGVTVPLSGTAAPEPATMALFCAALLLGVLFRGWSRRFRQMQ